MQPLRHDDNDPRALAKCARGVPHRCHMCPRSVCNLVISRGHSPPGCLSHLPAPFRVQRFLAGVGHGGCLALALICTPLRHAIAHLADGMTRRPVMTCGITLLLLAAGAVVVGHAHPLSMDEYAVVLQAQTFAQGHLAVQYPPDQLDAIVWPQFQNVFLLVNRLTGQVMSVYWPGFAALMTPFAAVQATWLLNPLLGAAGLWLIGDIAVQACGDRAARGWAMLATLASPQYTVMAMSYYSMPGLLTFNLLFLWLLLRPGPWSALLAGLSGSIALTFHNPVPHALFALPCIVWFLARPDGWRRLPWLLAGYLPLAALFGLGWPLAAAHAGIGRTELSNGDVTSPRGWLDQLASVLQRPSAAMLVARFQATWKVWIWSAPGLLALAALAAWKRRAAPLALLAATFALTFVFYLFVRFDQGHGWGYRYIHPAWALLPVGAALWVVRGGREGVALGSAIIAAGLLATPVFLWETRSTVDAALANRIDAPANGRWVVFVAPNARYVMDLVQNLPGRDRVRYFVGRSAAEDRDFMAAHFPEATPRVEDARGSLWELPADAR